MPRLSPHHALVGVLALGLSCAGGSQGCGGMQPFPNNGRYSGPKTNSAVAVRISPNGITYLNQNVQPLLESFAPGGVLQVPVACAPMNVQVLGNIVLADQGAANCTEESCGRMDGKCAGDVPANVQVKINSVQLTPRSPDALELAMSLSIETGHIFFDTADRSHGACVFLSPLKCSVNFSSARGGGAGALVNGIRAAAKFTIASRWDQLLAFELTSLQGTQICGSSGAPARPHCLDPDDIAIAGENTCGGGYCTVANVGFVKELLLQTMAPTIEKSMKDAIAKQSCQTCGQGQPPCPSGAGAQSTCTDGLCMDTGTNKCVPRLLGVEGRLAPAAFLSSFGVPETALLDLSMGAGGNFSIDQGINLGMRGGLQAPTVAECVTPAPAPALTAVPAPNFDGEVTPGTQYHVALSISQPFLSSALHHAQQSGALCANITGTQIGYLNTGLFGTFLPSLGKLAKRDGKDAPMLVALRPGKPPVARVGKGTFDPQTKRPIEPLLHLNMPELTFDIYALIDDRYVRLMSLTADVALPLSLVFEGCGKVQPAIGELKNIVTNIRVENAEILADEDTQAVAGLIPTILTTADSFLASALAPFVLPEVGGFKLKVYEAKGLGAISGTPDYNHLGLYASLVPANTACSTAGAPVFASLQSAVVPPPEQMTSLDDPRWPTAVLRVESPGAKGPLEVAYRIDGGLWSAFESARADGLLEISHPAFLLQGTHRIEVRARPASAPEAISAPTAVTFPLDWEAPRVSLQPNRAENRLAVVAHDVVTASESLRYAYRVGQGAWSGYGALRPIELSAVEAQGGVAVRVQDLAGNVAEVSYALTSDEAAALPTAIAAPADGEVGCASVGGGASSLWVIAALAALLRRRR